MNTHIIGFASCLAAVLGFILLERRRYYSKPTAGDALFYWGILMFWQIIAVVFIASEIPYWLISAFVCFIFGQALNAAVMIANGGYMPVKWSTMPPIGPRRGELAGDRLLLLCDRIHIGNSKYSAGDLVMPFAVVVGVVTGIVTGWK